MTAVDVHDEDARPAAGCRSCHALAARLEELQRINTAHYERARDLEARGHPDADQLARELADTQAELDKSLLAEEQAIAALVRWRRRYDALTGSRWALLCELLGRRA